MTEPTLTVLYSSPSGSTAQSAQWMARQVPGAVAQKIGAGGVPAKGALILAAPIRFDRWHRPMRDFVARNRLALEGRPVAAMFQCLSLSRTGPAAERNGATYRERVAGAVPGLAPDMVGGFAGVLDFAGIEWPLRPLARAAMGAMGVRAGDYRNWTAMEMWLRETVARLGRVA